MDPALKSPEPPIRAGQFVRSVAELAAISQYKPFSEDELNADGNTLFVAFVGDQPGTAVAKKLEALGSAIDAFHVNDREVYWLYRRNYGESKFYGGLLEKSVGMQATVRNSNTVQRLAKKYCKK